MANDVTVGKKGITIVPWGVVPTSMSQAAACVVTYASHGLDTGDIVSFNKITQANWTALNGIPFTVTKLTDDTFSIPVDTRGFGAYTDVAGMVYEDFNSANLFTNGLFISGFAFYGSAPNDLLVVRNKTYDGQKLIDRRDATGGGYHQSVGTKPLKLKPYIFMAECVFTINPSDAIITIEMA